MNFEEIHPNIIPSGEASVRSNRHHFTVTLRNQDSTRAQSGELVCSVVDWNDDSRRWESNQPVELGPGEVVSMSVWVSVPQEMVDEPVWIDMAVFGKER